MSVERSAMLAFFSPLSETQGEKLKIGETSTLAVDLIGE